MPSPFLEKYMKKYIIAQLTQTTFWVGLILAIGAFIAPRSYLALFGVLLIALDDDIVKNFVDKHAPWLSAKIDELTK